MGLKHPFTVSYGTRTHQVVLIVELEHLGISGFGEAPVVFYYNVKIEQWIEKIPEINQALANYAITTPEEFHAFLKPLLPDDPFLLAAIDEAGHDWFAKKQGKPLYEVWGSDPSKSAYSSFTIGLDTLETMVIKLKEEPDWKIYKIKLEASNAIEMVTELRKHTNAIFRVDANCSWTAEQTIAYSKPLKELGVEFIEQPLPKDNLLDMIKVKQESALPIIADEAVLVEEDVEKVKDYFHGINIKVEKCGGLTPARRMIQKAKTYGLKVMVGCMLEGTTAISALAHLLPELDYADMDGPALLKEDTDNASGVRITPTGVEFAKLPGTGAVIFPERAELTTD